MPISLVLRRERGDDIRRAEQAYVPPDATLDSDRYPLLWGVDPYANTIFNGRQMEQVLGEVEHLREEDLSAEELASLDAVAELCREGRQRPHRFLWFIGD